MFAFDCLSVSWTMVVDVLELGDLLLQRDDLLAELGFELRQRLADVVGQLLIQHLLQVSLLHAKREKTSAI